MVEDGSDDPRRFEVGAKILVDGRKTTIVVSRRVGKGRHAIGVEGPAPRGAELAVRRGDLPPPDEGSYYVSDLVGLTVVDERETAVGVIEDVLPGPANDVLQLDTGLLLPLVEDCVREVDLDARRVRLNPGFTG